MSVQKSFEIEMTTISSGEKTEKIMPLFYFG